MWPRAKTRVERRRVFYIPGYDPYPPRRYRELYRTESAKQAGISGYAIQQKALQGDTGWKVRADIEGERTLSRIDVLVWHDLVKSSMSGTVGATYLNLVRTAWLYLSTGVFRRLSWLAKGPVVAALYPIAMLLLQLLLATVIAGVAGSAVAFAITRGGEAALALMGRISDHLRPPLAPVRPETRDTLRDALAHLGMPHSQENE